MRLCEEFSGRFLTENQSHNFSSNIYSPIEGVAMGYYKLDYDRKCMTQNTFDALI